MAELDRIEVERIERNKYRFYRVLGAEENEEEEKNISLPRRDSGKIDAA